MARRGWSPLLAVAAAAVAAAAVAVAVAPRPGAALSREARLQQLLRPAEPYLLHERPKDCFKIFFFHVEKVRARACRQRRGPAARTDGVTQTAPPRLAGTRRTKPANDNSANGAATLRPPVRLSHPPLDVPVRACPDAYGSCCAPPTLPCHLKTGGTTVRGVFNQGGKAQGLEVYTQGMLKMRKEVETPCNGTRGWYASRCCSFERMLQDLESDPMSHPRLFVEVRASRLEREGRETIERLKAIREKNGAQCPVVLWTLMREPHRLYTSFYRFFAAISQRRKPELFGDTFEYWVPPNMQTEILGGSDIGFRAQKNKFGNNVSRWARDPATKQFVPRDPERVEYLLDSLDLIGTTGTFNAAMLMLSDLTGLSHILYKPSNLGNKRHFGPEELNAIDYGHLVPNPNDAEQLERAPDAEEAKRFIEDATSIDRPMFAKRYEAFKKRIEEEPDDFKLRLQRYERALVDFYKL